VAGGLGDQPGARASARGRLRASDADREQVIGALKDAFVQGRLTRDELGARTTGALTSRTYAELAAVTADIPAPVILPPPRPQPVRVPARKRVKLKTAAWTAAMMIAPPVLWAVFQTYAGGFIVIFLAAFAALVVVTPPTKPAGR
jgi:uncharacterized protein DUF1707